MRHMFVMAQFGQQIELVTVSPDARLEKGQTFERMPGIHKETWAVIKVFDHEDQRRLEALLTLMGISALNNLFAIEI